MRAAELPPGFVCEERVGAITLVRAELAEGARALGLFERDGIARAFAAGTALGGGRVPAALLAWPDGAHEIVVRRLHHGGVLGGVLGSAQFGASRVLGELAVTAQLFALGAPVPQPALVLARRRAGPIWECAIGSVRVPGSDFASWLLGPERERALRAAAIAVRSFHDAGGQHADLNATNLLLSERNGHLAATVIDLDRARVRAPVPAVRRMREIARLWRSLRKRGGGAEFSAEERDAFLAAYCAGDATLARELRAYARREQLRSALHAWRYPRR